MSSSERKLERSREKLRAAQYNHLRTLVAWFRGVGISSLLIGGIGLIELIPFWWAAGLVYTGFAVLLFDLWLEEGIKSWLKISLRLIIVGLALAFSFGIVFVKAPVVVRIDASDAEYPAGTVVAGIKWRVPFTEVRVEIMNTSKNDYRYLDLVLTPNEPIAAIAQTSDLPNTSFTDSLNERIRYEIVNLPTGASARVPLELIATTLGYRVRCDNLPAKRHLDLLLAIASIREASKERSGVSPSHPDYWVAMNRTNGSNWYGHADRTDAVYGSRRVPTTLSIRGSYTVFRRIRRTSQTVEVHNLIRDMLPQIMKGK